jgi:hypothetical protein
MLGAVNEYAWNNVANMLYLESPAGSGGSSGFSTCIAKGAPVDCSWNDTSQAEAYAHTLAAFFTSFPEYQDNDLYVTGADPSHLGTLPDATGSHLPPLHSRRRLNCEACSVTGSIV